jgi:hypothetical protein
VMVVDVEPIANGRSLVVVGRKWQRTLGEKFDKKISLRLIEEFVIFY